MSAAARTTSPHSLFGRPEIHSIERALAELAAGRVVIVVDDEHRENGGDLVFAAEFATPELVAFIVRYSSGILCVPMTGAECDRLALPPMHHLNQNRHGTAYTVSVDAKDGVTTGISAIDRAHTIRVLAEPSSTSADLTRPGHVLPLRAREGGVLVRARHTEAAVDLMTLAGLRPVAGISGIVSAEDAGEMAGLSELMSFAAQHGLALMSISSLIAYRRAIEVQVVRVADAGLPLAQGTFRAVGYRSEITGGELIALIYGELGDGQNVLVREHTECLTGEALGSTRCLCGPQLQAALATIVAEGRGVVLYVRGTEEGGVNLLDQLRRYQVQDAHLTPDADISSGTATDSLDYGTAAQVLADVGVTSMRLLTNDPRRRASIDGDGLRILSTVPFVVPPLEFPAAAALTADPAAEDAMAPAS